MRILLIAAMLTGISSSVFAAHEVACTYKDQDQSTSGYVPKSVKILYSNAGWTLLQDGRPAFLNVEEPFENRVKLSTTYEVEPFLLENEYQIVFDKCSVKLVISSIGEVIPPGADNQEFQGATINYNCTCKMN